MTQKTEPFSIHIDPSPDVFRRFSEWQNEVKTKIEASGAVVTEIEGCTFSGYLDPEVVDPRTIKV